MQSLAIDYQRISKRHFAAFKSQRVLAHLPFGFFQIGQAELGDRKNFRFERTANELALNADSGE